MGAATQIQFAINVPIQTANLYISNRNTVAPPLSSFDGIMQVLNVCNAELSLIKQSFGGLSQTDAIVLLQQIQPFYNDFLTLQKTVKSLKKAKLDAINRQIVKEFEKTVDALDFVFFHIEDIANEVITENELLLIDMIKQNLPKILSGETLTMQEFRLALEND